MIVVVPLTVRNVAKRLADETSKKQSASTLASDRGVDCDGVNADATYVAKDPDSPKVYVDSGKGATLMILDIASCSRDTLKEMSFEVSGSLREASNFTIRDARDTPLAYGTKLSSSAGTVVTFNFLIPVTIPSANDNYSLTMLADVPASAHGPGTILLRSGQMSQKTLIFKSLIQSALIIKSA